MSNETRMDGVNKFMKYLGWTVAVTVPIGVLCWVFGPIVIGIVCILCIAVIGVCG